MGSQTTDSLGTWEYLGLIQTIPNEWVSFPIPVVNSETIRFKFITNWENRKYPYASYGLIRPSYNIPELIIGSISRIYPSKERQIREYEIPDELQAKGIVTRTFSVKRVLRSRYADLPDLDPVWSVEAEYLVNT